MQRLPRDVTGVVLDVKGRLNRDGQLEASNRGGINCIRLPSAAASHPSS